MPGRGHGKELQMDYGRVNRSGAMLEFVLCVIATGISLVHAQKAHRDTVRAVAVIKA